MSGPLRWLTRPAAASFDRIVEFVNFAIAIALVAASWVLVVELVGWFDRHNHR